ncbi:ABC-F family ATP-binding cassette domain-containing protein [bacterium]|nr:ABC-F family ATP-binding cassette domain-containing protein [bacterium]
MSNDATIVRFEDVSYEYGAKKQILDRVSFGIRRGSKLTLMGQNGAGKSTLFKLITGEHQPEDGEIHRAGKLSIALSRQVIPRAEMDLTVREFFEKCFDHKVYDIDPRIDEVLEVVNLVGHAKMHERVIKSFSGGQQARLLLASALIQDPDLLLLDEPTNNLDKAGIAHLTQFLIDYDKSVIVISHDADFLNAFTQGVLYLDVHTHTIEQYVGNYTNVLKDITARVEKENMKNAQLEKTIAASKEKMNFFAQKGGKMRLVAKKMRTKIEEAEEDVVDVRREDKTIKGFTIPAQEDLAGPILTIDSYTTLKDHKPKKHTKHLELKKKQHLLLTGPNGIGKSTLLESIANGTAEGAVIQKGIRVGYYRQDFSNLDFEKTVYQELAKAMKIELEEKLRATAAGFLITGDMIHAKIGHLSEGQKGLVALARLVLLKPGLLILDEPTNHMNFRHLPVIAKALDQYEGAMILVSHVPEFVKQIRIDETLDLAKN